MRAMVLDAPESELREADVQRPELRPGQVRIRVGACAVCRTDLHIRDGELRDPKLPLILGHQIVGAVVEGDASLAEGTRVGVPWLGWTCGECRYCLSGRENLCDRALFTGFTLDGGYAEEAVADVRYCFALHGIRPPADWTPARRRRATGDGRRTGTVRLTPAQRRAWLAVHCGPAPPHRPPGCAPASPRGATARSHSSLTDVCPQILLR
jgi:propanol-preferring alcohol dehydrogenase